MSRVILIESSYGTGTTKNQRYQVTQKRMLCVIQQRVVIDIPVRCERELGQLLWGDADGVGEE